jgi:hypothetical protein
VKASIKRSSSRVTAESSSAAATYRDGELRLSIMTDVPAPHRYTVCMATAISCHLKEIHDGTH